MEVTAAAGKLADTTADTAMTFYDGKIRLQQKGARNAKAIAKLAGKLQCPKGKGEQARPARRAGRWRRRRAGVAGASGEAAAAVTELPVAVEPGSVVRTTWLTQDTCNRTLFGVTEGIGIKVLDFRLDRKVTLGPGQKYFARSD